MSYNKEKDLKIVECYFCKKEFEVFKNRSTTQSVCEVCRRDGKRSPLDNKIYQRTKQRMLELYGVEHALQRKDSLEKMKKTNISRRGVEWSTQDKTVVEKGRTTNLQKLGVDNVSKSEKIKLKKKNTIDKNKRNNKNYDSEIQLKREETLRSKFGENFYQVLHQKCEEGMMKKFNVKSSFSLPSTREKSLQSMREKHNIVSNIMEKIEFRSKISETKRTNKEPEVLEQLKILKLQFLDENYIDNTTLHNFKCLNVKDDGNICGNLFKQHWNAIQQGYKCEVCYPRSLPYSKQEKEVLSFIQNLEIEIEENRKFKDIGINYELDIFIPSLKFGIEYNGLYWHSEERLQNKYYHRDKTDAFLKQGIQVVQIFEDEWIFKQDIVKARLMNKLGLNLGQRVHARECDIKEINYKEKNEFLLKYHIQGKDRSVLNLGAFYDNKLISLMTFSYGNFKRKIHKENKIYELSRFCSNYNYHIPGIAGKLLEHFKRSYDWNEIFTYADRRWSNGNLYEKLGFEKDGPVRMNYWWIKGVQRIHRFKLRKRPDEPKDISEIMLRRKEGYSDIWDCGNLKFRMIKQKENIT